MPPPVTDKPMPERIDMLVNDVQAHAKSLTEITKTLIEIDKRAVADAKDKEHLDERLDRIELSIAETNKRITAIYRLGWWILAAFGTSAVSLIANFMFRGGFIVS